MGAFSWSTERELTAFCLGAFRDAACLRTHAVQTPTASANMHGSARCCILALSTALALCLVIGHFLPGIESERETAHAFLPDGVILIEVGEYGGSGRPAIAFEEYRSWETQQQRFFSKLAYYRMAKERVKAGSVDRGPLQVAHATQNLPALLGAALPQDAAADDASAARVILSRSMWRRVFQADSGAIGQDIVVGHHTLRIAGIAPAGAAQLPGHADLWVVETSASLARTSRRVKGHVIALLSPMGKAEMTGGEVGITAFTPAEDAIAYHGIRLAPSTDGPLAIYIFALLLAVLALPAITSVFQTESGFDSHRPSVAARLKRCAFLMTKVGLIAALGYSASLDLAYCGFQEYAAAEFLQFASSFFICLFGFRWALVDQSRRCPVCLRLVTHPAQVGIASCTFLGWNGTEMICTGGHALLHVPSLPTSWFSRQRWMYLDTSWDFLFLDSPEPL